MESAPQARFFLAMRGSKRSKVDVKRVEMITRVTEEKTVNRVMGWRRLWKDLDSYMSMGLGRGV